MQVLGGGSLYHEEMVWWNDANLDIRKLLGLFLLDGRGDITTADSPLDGFLQVLVHPGIRDQVKHSGTNG